MIISGMMPIVIIQLVGLTWKQAKAFLVTGERNLKTTTKKSAGKQFGKIS